MLEIKNNLESVRQRVAASCRACGRDPAQVGLLAVSKTFGPEAVAQAYAGGQLAFGENYIQEAVEKIQALAALPLQWHCIGPVQSNKTRLVAEHFDWVQSIDRLKIAERLSAQRPPARGLLQVCIQVNIDGEPSKSGVPAEEALALAQAVAALPGLRLRGIMTIPEPAASKAAALAVHRRAKDLFAQLRSAGLDLDTLSMGMSGDLEPAIEAGSTLVRIGSAIFGARSA